MMVGKKVKVYFNLHRSLWSVQDAKTRLVIAHLPEVYLEDVEFKVSESGRQRVLKEKRKNVHAFATGVITDPKEGMNTKVSYNPYKYGNFYEVETEEPVFSAESAYLTGRNVYIN